MNKFVKKKKTNEVVHVLWMHKNRIPLFVFQGGISSWELYNIHFSQSFLKHQQFSAPPKSYLCKDYRLSVPSAKAAIKSLCGWHDFVKLLTVQDPFHVRTQFTSTQIFDLPADGFLHRREVWNVQFKNSRSHLLKALWPTIAADRSQNYSSNSSST